MDDTGGLDASRELISRDQLAARVTELAGEISADLGGQPLTIAALMTGALIFVADLVRHLPLMTRIHLAGMSSYPGPATTSQGPQVIAPIAEDLHGQNVLIVDDILDSGRTLSVAVEHIRQAGAREVHTCVLLRKPADQRAPDGLADADYVGFDIPNEFVVGYGLDHDDFYRNLPHVAVLEGV